MIHLPTICTIDLHALAKEIGALPGVLRASAWTRVATMERIYIELTKYNRQQCYQAGAGRVFQLYPSGRCKWITEWAGAATRDWHTENRTMERIQEALDEARKKAPPYDPGKPIPDGQIRD